MFCQVNDTAAVYEAGIKLRVKGLGRPNVFLRTSLIPDEYFSRKIKQGLRHYNRIHQEDSLVVDSSANDQSRYQLQQWFAGRKDIVPLTGQKIDSLFIRNGNWDYANLIKNKPAYRGYVQLSPVYFNVRRDKAFFICSLHDSKCGTGADRYYFFRKNAQGKWENWDWINSPN